MRGRALVNTRVGGHTLVEVMVASAVGMLVITMGLESLLLLHRMAINTELRDLRREQAEWVLAYMTTQLRDAAVGAAPDMSALLHSPGGEDSILRLSGRFSVDCLGRLDSPQQMIKTYSMVRSGQGHFDLRCAQQGAGDGVWTLASDIPGLGMVMGIDSDDDGITDRHTGFVPPAEGQVPLVATISIALGTLAWKAPEATRDSGVVPLPSWWVEGSMWSAVKPHESEWWVTAVRLSP